MYGVDTDVDTFFAGRGKRDIEEDEDIAQNAFFAGRGKKEQADNDFDFDGYASFFAGRGR